MEIGTRLGHYEIIDRLGAGGMGEVCRAKDTKLKREVALKLLAEDLVTNGRAPISADSGHRLRCESVEEPVIQGSEFRRSNIDQDQEHALSSSI